MNGWSQRLESKRKEKGWTRAQLARQSGVPQDSVYKYLKGKVDQPRGEILKALADAFGVRYLWLREGIGPELSSFPIVGRVGAGETFIPFDENPQGYGYGRVEFDLDSADPIAIQVHGNSMVPVYRPGDMLLCSRHKGEEIAACLGKDCVVMTEDDLGFVKRLQRGSSPGHFNLVSYNADVIENVRLRWCAPIIWVRRS